MRIQYIFISLLHNFMTFLIFRYFLHICVGKYEPYVLSGKDWKKATGKDGKLFKHEQSQAHQVATESYRARVSSMENNTSVAAKLSQVSPLANLLANSFIHYHNINVNGLKK